MNDSAKSMFAAAGARLGNSSTSSSTGGTGAVRRTRNGKIARLPLVVREELNRRMLDGEMGEPLVAWLNELPEVRRVMAAEFGGRAVRVQNLSEWRKRGFREWALREEAVAVLRRWKEGGDGEIGSLGDGESLTEALAAWMAAQYAVMGRRVAEMPGAEGWRFLRGMCADVVALRRGDQRAKRMEREWERRRQRTGRAKPGEAESIRVNRGAQGETELRSEGKPAHLAPLDLSGAKAPQAGGGAGRATKPGQSHIQGAIAESAGQALPRQVRFQGLNWGTRRQVGADSDQERSESIRVNPAKILETAILPAGQPGAGGQVRAARCTVPPRWDQRPVRWLIGEVTTPPVPGTGVAGRPFRERRRGGGPGTT